MEPQTKKEEVTDRSVSWTLCITWIWRNGCPKRIGSGLIEISNFKYLLNINILQHSTLDAGIATMGCIVSALKELKIKLVVLLQSFCEVKQLMGRSFFICNLKLPITLMDSQRLWQRGIFYKVAGGGSLCL